MISSTLQLSNFQTPIKNQCSPPVSSPSSISTTSTNSKQRSITDDDNHDETITKIKIEEGTDEVKIFTIQKHDPDDDVDIDGIEDRLSPVVVEPVSFSHIITINFHSFL
jgi:hypothetical protein